MIVSGNGSSLEPFQCRGICDKFRKKVVKDVGIICRDFYVGRGQYPPCHRMWCGICYVEQPKDYLPKSWE